MGQYPNLPGYTTTLTDGMLKFAPNQPGTDRVLLLGVALKGPLHEVAYPKSLSEAESIFGDIGLDNPLVLGFKEALDAGCEDVVLMALDLGVAASLVLTFDEGEGEGAKASTITIVANRKTSLHNGALTVDRADDTLVFSSPYLESNVIVDMTDGEGEGALYLAVEDLAEDVIVALSDLPFTVLFAGDEAVSAEELEALGVGGATLASGTLVFDQADLKTELEGAGLAEMFDGGVYELLLTTDADVIVVLGAEAETIAQCLAEFCSEASNNDDLVLGVIAANAKDPDDSVADYFDYLMDQDIEFTVTKTIGNGQVVIDAGKFISIVVGAGELALAAYYTNDLAASYAGRFSALAPQSSTTNKTMNGCTRLGYTFTAQQLNDLTGKGYVTFRSRPGRGVVITDGVTAAKQGSQFARLTTMRCLAVVVRSVREVGEPFIGEPGDVVQRNALNTAIKSIMDAIKQAGVVQSYVFTITSSPSELVQGIFNIDMEIVPVFELRKIRTRITLRPEI